MSSVTNMFVLKFIQKYFYFILPKKFNGALLGLLWCFMMFLYTDFLGEYIVTLLYQWNMDSPILIRLALSVHYIMSLLFPLVGTMADIWTGRYRIIVVSMYCCFIGWLVSAVSYFTVTVPLVSVIFLLIGMALQIIGIAGFHSNILAFVIDQAIGASGDELSSFLQWYFVSYPSGLWLLSLLGGICLSVSGASIVITMSTYYLYKHLLDTSPLISNPIKLIFKVLNYARKTKYPENRSALTYYLDEAPSRIDLCKNKYGGPFKEEQVEDVKTILRFFPLLVCIIVVALSFEVVHYVRYLTGTDKSLQGVRYKYLQCIIDTKGVFNLSSFMYLLIFKVIIHPCFNRYLPSMLKRILIGLGVCLLSVLMYLAIDLAASFNGMDNSCWLNTSHHHNATGIDYHWVLFPEIFSGIGFGMTFCVFLEFTVAQSPGHMRGLMIGVFYGTGGIALIFSTTLNLPFGYINTNSSLLTCTLLYHISKSVLVFMFMLLFSIFAKCYKLRVREEDVNIHRIVSGVYTRYLYQADRLLTNEFSN